MVKQIFLSFFKEEKYQIVIAKTLESYAITMNEHLPVEVKDIYKEFCKNGIIETIIVPMNFNLDKFIENIYGLTEIFEVGSTFTIRDIIAKRFYKKIHPNIMLEIINKFEEKISNQNPVTIKKIGEKYKKSK
ncbi:MAG: hypothetical protein LBV03_01915 [Fusobacteriales bacterium]|jgi:hypothetical protein|nr:hypothetical protein [Fusobacteriales bacterium]